MPHQGIEKVSRATPLTYRVERFKVLRQIWYIRAKTQQGTPLKCAITWTRAHYAASCAATRARIASQARGFHRTSQSQAATAPSSPQRQISERRCWLTARMGRHRGYTKPPATSATAARPPPTGETAGVHLLKLLLRASRPAARRGSCAARVRALPPQAGGGRTTSEAAAPPAAARKAEGCDAASQRSRQHASSPVVQRGRQSRLRLSCSQPGSEPAEPCLPISSAWARQRQRGRGHCILMLAAAPPPAVGPAATCVHSLACLLPPHLHAAQSASSSPSAHPVSPVNPLPVPSPVLVSRQVAGDRPSSQRAAAAAAAVALPGVELCHCRCRRCERAAGATTGQQ